MASLVFVHGAGVRLQDYQEAEKRVRDGLWQSFHNTGTPIPDLVPCMWGESVGAHLDSLTSKSIPGYRDTGGGEKPVPELWDVLAYDPLYEIRILSMHESRRTVNVRHYDGLVIALPGDASHPRLAVLGVSEDDFASAVQMIRADPAFESAVLSAHDQRQLNPFIGRAIVAAIVFRAPAGASVRTDPDGRDGLAEALTEDLGGVVLGPDAAIPPGMRSLAGFFGVSRHMAKRRGQITDDALLKFMDVVRYQARGDAVRRIIRGIIRQASSNGPVVVLAHSLGGIACVDLFAMDKEVAGQVKCLVTAGSQSPLLYEMGELQGIGAGQPIPDHFPAWTNIYDRRDFLSFVGQEVFHKRLDGSVGIVDREVDNHVPVWDAHSAYWTNPQLWKIVRDVFFG